MKLTRENIYVPLEGKSKEELTELWELVKHNLWLNKDFRENSANETLHYDEDSFIGCSVNFCIEEGKTEVTIQQLKEILQPMENKEFDLKGYSVEVDNEVQARQLQEYASKQGFKWYNGETVWLLDKKFFNFNAFNKNRIYFDNIHFKDEYVTKEIHFNDIFKTEPTLTEQLEKAEAEVKRLKESIEGSMIKDEDWVVNLKTGTCSKYKNWMNISHNWVKITDQELINKLNGLIK